MKQGYLETSLLLILLVYFGWKFQMAMSRHAHPHRLLNLDECHRCAPGHGVSRPCSRHHDTECTACSPGHYSSHHSARRPCYPCSRCGMGLYVAHHCTPSRDTVCDSCHTYRGPHNEDFYERCLRPLREAQHAPHLTKENVTYSRGVPTSIVIVCSVVAGLLAIALVTVVSRRRHCKRVDPRYEAVATQEAVML